MPNTSISPRTWPRVTAVVISLHLLSASLGCSPTANQGWIAAGKVRVTGGSVLISDPLYLPDTSPDLTVQVQGIAPGSYEVEVWQADLGEYGQRITRARILFLPVASDARKLLGSVAVDSASLIAIDPAHIATEWVVVGPRRDGLIVGTDKAQIADLLRANGFPIGATDGWSIQLSSPVSQEDELRVNDLIRASGLSGLLIIETGSSFEQVVAMLEDTSGWGEIPFADGSPGLGVAFTSGVGDGEYSVYGLFKDTTLVGLEVDMW